MASENILQVTDASFEAEVLKSEQPVLIDFWAPWCGPCRAVAPVVEALAKDYAGKIKVGKVNTDDNQKVATDYHISSIPSLLLFKGGKVAGQIVGVAPRAKLEELIKKHL